MLSLIFFIVTRINKIEKKESSFLQSMNISTEPLNLNKLLPLEKEVLDNFKKIPKNEYSYKYKEIIENNRSLLNLHSRQNVGAYILKSILNSNELLPEQRLYTLNKLRIIDMLSGNIVETIKITIEYLDLAKDLNSEYDVARAKIGLSSIISSLGGNKTTIAMLKHINLENKSFDSINRVKISRYIHLAENYFFIEEYEKSFECLNKISNLLKNEPNDYQMNILLLENFLKTSIFLKLNNSEKALETLNFSKSLLDNIKKHYFADLNNVYILNLESYNLKYRPQNFNAENVKNYIENSQQIGDIIYMKKAYDILFQYYFETNKFTEYRELELIHNSYLKRIGNANNKFFTLYLIENLENERVAAENKKLYIHISILLLGSLFISIISFKKIQYLDKKSKIDALTNIGNRLSFNIKIDELKDKSYNMLLFDVDNFKKINDTYGHDFGDEVLATIGKILKTIENKEINIYRVGGEEFSIIFTNLNKTFCIDSCEFIRKSIENIKWKHPIIVTMSGGFSHNNGNIYIECDLKLYKAKSSGKNMIIY